MALELDGTAVELRHDDAVVAQGRVIEFELDVPQPVSLPEAEEASMGYAGFAAPRVRDLLRLRPGARGRPAGLRRARAGTRARRHALDASRRRGARGRVGRARLPERVGRRRLPARGRPPRAHGGAGCAPSSRLGSRTSSRAGPWPTTAASATRDRRSGRRTATFWRTPAPPGSSRPVTSWKSRRLKRSRSGGMTSSRALPSPGGTS